MRPTPLAAICGIASRSSAPAARSDGTRDCAFVRVYSCRSHLDAAALSFPTRRSSELRCALRPAQQFAATPVEVVHQQPEATERGVAGLSAVIAVGRILMRRL